MGTGTQGSSRHKNETAPRRFVSSTATGGAGRTATASFCGGSACPSGRCTRDAARYSLAIAFPFDLSDGSRVSTRLTTSFGSGAYLSSVAICWASGEIIHLRKSRMAFALAASGCSVCTSSQVKDEIGYASLPGALVMDTRKSVFLSNLALAAAAVTEASDGSTNSPAGFLIKA